MISGQAEGQLLQLLVQFGSVKQALILAPLLATPR